MSFPSKAIIFVPNYVEKRGNVFLYGSIEEEVKENITLFCVLNVEDKDKEKLCLGVCADSAVKYDSINETFIHLTKESNCLKVKKVTYKGQDITNFLDENVVILYDPASFSSQYLQQDQGSLFSILQIKLLSQKATKIKFNRFLNFVVYFFTFLTLVFNKFLPVLKFSSIGMQLKCTLDRFLWALKTISANEQKSVKVVNFLVSVFLDVLLGTLSLQVLLAITSANDFPNLFLSVSESCITSLRNLLNWLAGSPAGFKLNREFNNILAKFFLFHTDIWWMFLELISPGLKIVFQAFMFLGQFGLTFQAAILLDILALVSFHIYCIYAYAARLYSLQLAGLRSLLRLFVGRKWNPLREKVDSCQYTVDQLFVGTLLFTILLFLLPTTLVYYVVFTLSRVVIVAVGGVLTRTCLLLHAVPVYSTLLWLMSAPSVSPEVRIDPDMVKSSAGCLVLRARRVPDSLFATIVNFAPDCIEVPVALPGGIFRILATGELLYPF